MAVPGEIPHDIGRAYSEVLLGSLERSLRRFRRTFEVHSEPHKVSFIGPTGKEFSFDAAGILRELYTSHEVFVECKGYQDGSKLLDSYKEFLARAYAVSVLYSRHRSDLFWFVTNVPFGSSVGRALTSAEFMHASLVNARTSEIREILGGSPVDERYVRSLKGRVAVCVFTDSFIRLMGVELRVKAGETVWSIVKKLHAGRMPRSSFQPIAQEVAVMNKLDNPNRIKAGQRLHVPWYGLPY
jgi:hypothetical protein